MYVLSFVFEIQFEIRDLRLYYSTVQLSSNQIFKSQKYENQTQLWI